MTSGRSLSQSGEESRGFSENVASTCIVAEATLENRRQTLQCETPLLKAILAYHKEDETTLRASCF
jgi:hypothetical protein